MNVEHYCNSRFQFLPSGNPSNLSSSIEFTQSLLVLSKNITHQIAEKLINIMHWAKGMPEPERQLLDADELNRDAYLFGTRLKLISISPKGVLDLTALGKDFLNREIEPYQVLDMARSENLMHLNLTRKDNLWAEEFDWFNISYQALQIMRAIRQNASYPLGDYPPLESQAIKFGVERGIFEARTEWKLTVLGDKAVNSLDPGKLLNLEVYFPEAPEWPMTSHSQDFPENNPSKKSAGLSHLIAKLQGANPKKHQNGLKGDQNAVDKKNARDKWFWGFWVPLFLAIITVALTAVLTPWGADFYSYLKNGLKKPR